MSITMFPNGQQRVVTLEDVIETGSFERWLRENLTWQNVGLYTIASDDFYEPSPASAEFKKLRKDMFDLLYSDAAGVICESVQNSFTNIPRIEDKRLKFNNEWATIQQMIRTKLSQSHNRALRDKADLWTTLLLIRTYADMFDLGMVLFFYFTGRISNIHIIDRKIALYANDGRVYLSALPAAESAQSLLSRGSQLAQIQGGTYSMRFDGVQHAANLNSPYGHRMALRQKTPAPSRFIGVIRLHQVSNPTLEDLVSKEVLTDDAAQFIQRAVLANVPIIIAGAPGSGKTTLLRAISRGIPRSEPVFVAENYRELRLDQLTDSDNEPWFTVLHAHVEHSENAEGVGGVSMQTILEKGLQEDVKRIIIGEVTDPATMKVLLQAANTGQSGLLATIHAESLGDSVARVQGLLMESSNFTAEAAGNLIQRTLKMIIHTAHIRTSNGDRRFITGIGWVVPHPGTTTGSPQVLNGYIRTPAGQLERGADFGVMHSKLAEIESRLQGSYNSGIATQK